MAGSVSYVGWNSGPWSRGLYGEDYSGVLVDGNEAEAQLGNFDVETQQNPVSFDYVGWGSGPWSRGAWGEDTLAMLLAGNEAISFVGNVQITAKAVVSVSGVEGLLNLGEASEVGKANIYPIGTQAIGQIGTVDTEINFTQGVNGVQGNVDVGTATAYLQQIAIVSGVEASGEIGESVAPDYRSWGGGYWGGPLGWGGRLNAQTTLTGVVGTGETGDVEIDAKAVVFPSGVEGTALLGETNEEIGVYTTGTTGITGLGSVSLRIEGNVFPVGVESTIQIGDISVRNVNYIGVSGLVAAGAVGTVEIDAKANVSLTGVFAVGYVQRPLVWGIIDTAQTPNWQPIAEAA